MKVEILRDKLLEVVGQAERVSGKHVTLPVLSCVVLEAKGGEVVVRATNLDVGIELNIPAKVEEEGVIALNPALVKTFLTNLSSAVKNVVLESITSGSCKISSPFNEVVLNIVSPDDFPVIPKVTDGKTFAIQAKELAFGLKSVVWASSISTIKPELASVYVYEERGDLVFVATDSFRLAERRIKTKKINEFDPILIPFKNAIEIIHTFENSGEELGFVVSKNQLSLVGDHVHVSSRVIDGNFPDYKQILPKEFSTTITLLKQDLIQALKLSGAFSDSFNQILISVHPKDKNVEIETKNNEIGQSKQTIRATVDGDSISLSFNHRYIYDCLSSIDGESVLMKIVGPQKPMIISNPTEQGFTYLVMSMNR